MVNFPFATDGVYQGLLSGWSWFAPFVVLAGYLAPMLGVTSRRVTRLRLGALGTGFALLVLPLIGTWVDAVV